MSDDPVVFGMGDAKRIDAVVSAVERQVIDARPGTRRRFADSSGVTPDDVTHMRGCGCCDCFNCVPSSSGVIQGCASCQGGMPLRWQVDIGTWVEYPNLSENLTLINKDCGCTYTSTEREVSVTETVDGDPVTLTGVYNWVMVVGESTTLTLTFVSGDDALGIDSGEHAAVWVSTDPWRCLCDNPMVARNPDSFPIPNGLKCKICITPIPSTPTCDDWCFIMTLSGVAGPDEATANNGTFVGTITNQSWPFFPYGELTNEHGAKIWPAWGEGDENQRRKGGLRFSRLTENPGNDLGDEWGHGVSYIMDPWPGCRDELVFTRDQSWTEPWPGHTAEEWEGTSGWPETVTLRRIKCDDVPECAEGGGGGDVGGCSLPNTWSAVPVQLADNSWAWSYGSQCCPGYTQGVPPVSASEWNSTFGTAPYSAYCTEAQSVSSMDETLTGTIDGSNDTFTTQSDFQPGEVAVFVNGIKQSELTDFTTSGTNTIIFTEAPETGDTLTVSYERAT